MLVPNKMQHVICTGNLGSKEQYEELRNLAPNVHVVTGDFEYTNILPSESSDGTGGAESSSPMTFPDTKVVQVGDFR